MARGLEGQGKEQGAHSGLHKTQTIATLSLTTIVHFSVSQYSASDSMYGVGVIVTCPLVVICSAVLFCVVLVPLSCACLALM